MNVIRSSSFILLTVLFSLIINKVSGQSALISKERERLSSIKDSIELINSMNYVGMLYQGKNIDSCFYYGTKAKALSIQLQYAKGEADADNVIGTSLFLRGLFKESLGTYSSVLTRYRQQADTANVVQVLMNMGQVYGTIADTIKSKMYFQQALAIAPSLKQDSILSMLYVNYCIYSPSLSKDSINYYLDKSQEVAQRYNSDWIPVLVMQLRASLMIHDRKEEALPMLKESLYSAKKLSMELLEMNSLVLLGNYYGDDLDSALSYYHLAYDVMTASGYKNQLVPAAQTILEATKLTGNLVAVNQAHEVMQDALRNETETLKAFIGDYVKYNAIQENNKLLEISNKSKQTKIGLLISLCVVSCLLAVFIYWQYLVSRRLNRTIFEQNINLQSTLTALEESQGENTKMMTIVAHDLRNPLGAIMMAASMLIKKPEDFAKKHNVLEIITESADRSLKLVNELLSTQTKAEELKKEPVDLAAMLRYCAGLLEHKATAKRQHIKLDVSSLTLYGSHEKLWRVISNLIGNAIKFSPESAVIAVSLEKQGPCASIAVKDHGIGIPEEMKDKVFDMFTETKRSGTAGEQPFGLGLAICKQIVEAHKGRIWYESVLGSGTTFFVLLPVGSKEI